MAGTENEMWQSADSDESVSRWKLLQHIKAPNESEFSNWNVKENLKTTGLENEVKLLKCDT